jgi:hypothetical protein
MAVSSINDVIIEFIQPSTLEDVQTIIVDGEELADLVEISPDRPRLDGISMLRPILVSKGLGGRPDLICDSVFGDQNLFDILCQYNGYSNPYSIPEGVELQVPTIDAILAIKKAKISKPLKNKTLVELNKKLPVKDKKRFLDTANVDEIRTPNILPDNIPAINVSNDVIELGVGVTTKKCKDKLSQPQLLSEQVKEAIKKKIFEINNPKITLKATIFKTF